MEEILPVEESTGAVVVLGGSGTHPPAEVTPIRWAELLKSAEKSVYVRKTVLEEMFASPNYATLPYSSAYDLEHFSVEETQKALLDALNSPASIRSMSKHYDQDFTDISGEGPTIRAILAEHNRGFLKKGQTLVKAPVLDAAGNHTGAFVEEGGVSETRRDNPDSTACSNCGSPNDLKVCSGCRQKFFCSRSCQRVRAFNSLFDRSVHLLLRRFGRRDIKRVYGFQKEVTYYIKDSKKMYPCR